MGTVITPHFVSRALSLRRILCHGRCRCVAAVGIVLWSCLLRGHGGCHHAMLCHGRGCCMVVGTVITPCFVLWALSLHRVLCCGHYHHTVFCVAGTVDAWPRWASCCGCVCCVATVGVVALCCVVVGVVAWLWWVLSHHVVSWSQWVCHVT